MHKSKFSLIIMFIYIILLSQASFAESPRSFKVVFDESHFLQGWPVWDTSFFGKSKLATCLMDEGYIVDVNTLPLDKIINDLGKGDVLVLSEAVNASYRPGEIEAVREFVKRGGGILVISEHDNSVGMSDFQKGIVANYGIHFNNDAIRITEEKAIKQKHTWIKASSPFLKMENIGLFCSASLTYDKDVNPLLVVRDENIKNGEAVAGVYKKHGDGRIIAIGDSEFYWNGGIIYGQNKNFTLEIIKWLSGEEVKKTIPADYNLFTANEMEITLYSEEILTPEISGGTVNLVKQRKNKSVWNIKVEKDGWVRFVSDKGMAVVYFLLPKNNEGMKFLIDESHYARKADASLSGLYKMACFLRDNGILTFSSSSGSYKEYDAVLIATPLEEYKRIPDLSSSKRIILLGEFHLALEGTDSICRSARKMGFEKLGDPLNDIAANFGMTFSRFALCKDDNIFFEYPVYKGCIVGYEKNNFDVWIKGDEKCWGEDIGSGMISPLTKGENDLSDTTIMIANDRILASGDTDIFTNAHISESQDILNRIIIWLKK
ncbi:MAG: hypothetical protein JW871_00140 [Endomicrobiales bacterium]|nr:hypothetical protein [Endomicrobiales bacterium]